eukprot:COSAG05_NODE_1856_length_3955_cov_1.812241_3_plen_178_part_00
MIDSKTLDGLIDESDLHSILQRLGYEPQPGEVQDIIWEVDDDRDGGLTWEEFSALYERIRNDKEFFSWNERMRGAVDGREPHCMYTLIEFLMFDLDADGFVSLEETVELFYRRYGRAVLFKRKGVDGMASGNKEPGHATTATERRGSMLSFLNLVKHDIAFYPVSCPILRWIAKLRC